MMICSDLCQADLPSVSQDCCQIKMEVSAGYKHDLNQPDSQRFQRSCNCGSTHIIRLPCHTRQPGIQTHLHRSQQCAVAIFFGWATSGRIVPLFVTKISDHLVLWKAEVNEERKWGGHWAGRNSEQGIRKEKVLTWKGREEKGLNQWWGLRIV